MPKQRQDELGSFAGTDATQRLAQTTRRVGHREDAEDILQDSYLKVLRGGGTDRIDNLPAFLSRSVRNLATDLFRKRGRRRGETGLDDMAIEPADPLADPERTLAARQDLEKIQAAINRLPKRCRQAFVLHRFHGLSYGEIAVRLGVSRSSVEKYIIRALEACRGAVLG